MKKLNSEGICLFCKKSFKKSGMTRHLNTHLAEKEKIGKPGISFHLKVEQSPRWGVAPWFLNLWVDGETQMGDIDEFLREIWLECCGHMSSFRPVGPRPPGGMFDFFEAEKLLEQGKTEEYEQLMEATSDEIPKSRAAKAALKPDMKIEYQYDFGSTTELLITIAGVFSCAAPNEIVLLSRNEPLAIMCEVCNAESARTICMVCGSDGEPSLFCKSCGQKHKKTCEDYADYAQMPVVNSPRMGVCAYEGGYIDKGRDGIFKPKSE
ncbi:MAG: hypothetical protein ABI169_11065 [Chitinophagaceae bacterium]